MAWLLPVGGLCLRILSFTSLYPNNVNPLQGIFIHQRVIHLARCPGMGVEVIAPVPFFPSWLPATTWRRFGQIRRKEKIDGIFVHHPRYPLVSGISMPLHGWLVFLGCLRLARYLHQKNRFDCIDAHFVYPDGFAAVLLGKVLGIPVVISARGTDINLYPSYALIRPQLQWALRSAAGIIAVSADLKRKIIALGIPEEKVQVISNGVDVQRFQPRDSREARRRLRLMGEGPILVSVGSLIESKGHHLLTAAVAEVLPRFRRLRLYVIGEGVYRPRLEELIRKKHLQDNVFLMGSQPNEELAFWFSAADLSCLMSSREGWPNVVTESLACGTPVLATSVGGIPEILVSAELGAMVEREVCSIARGLEESLSKHWDREAISSKARARSWNTVAEEVATLFQSKLP